MVHGKRCAKLMPKAYPKAVCGHRNETHIASIYTTPTLFTTHNPPAALKLLHAAANYGFNVASKASAKHRHRQAFDLPAVFTFKPRVPSLISFTYRFQSNQTRQTRTISTSNFNARKYLRHAILRPRRRVVCLFDVYGHCFDRGCLQLRQHIEYNTFVLCAAK